MRSRNYWLSSLTPAAAPHLMPVWGVWLDGQLWFSSSNGSRKARNLALNALCSVATEDPTEPVVVKGTAARITARHDLERMLLAENEKYGTDYGLEMVDPESNSVFALRPAWVFALDSGDFTGSPTRFDFGAGPDS